MKKSWDRRPGETPKARAAFRVFLSLGPGRTYAKVAKELGHPASYERMVKQWGTKHGWQDRAQDYDEQYLKEAAQLRPFIREAVLQRLSDAAVDAFRIVYSVAQGRLDEGDTVPILDRHGEVVGEKPVVKGSTRLQAAQFMLGCIGVLPPKRVEHTGMDGAEIRVAHEVAKGLTDDELTAIRLALGDAVHTPPPMPEPVIGPSYQDDSSSN